MFCLMWGPTIAAVSVVLDHASDPALVRKALDGLLTAAKIASFHHVDEVMDSLVVSLSKFTSILDPSTSKPALAFGENEKVRMATQTMFTLANRSGSSLLVPPKPHLGLVWSSWSLSSFFLSLVEAFWIPSFSEIYFGLF